MHQEGFNSETTLILQAFSRTRRGEEEKKKTKKKAAAAEEEDSESETEAILRAQVAARATAAELPPGFDGYECEAEEPFEDSDDEEPDDGETIDGESEDEGGGESEGIGDAARVHDPYGEDTEDDAETVRSACPRPSPSCLLRARG